MEKNKAWEKELLKDKKIARKKNYYSRIFKSEMKRRIKGFNKRMDLLIDNNKHLSFSKMIIRTAIIENVDGVTVMHFGIYVKEVHVKLTGTLEFSDLSNDSIKNVVSGMITRISNRHRRIMQDIDMSEYDGSKVFNENMDRLKGLA